MEMPRDGSSPGMMLLLVVVGMIVLGWRGSFARAEALPPLPKYHFLDQYGAVSPEGMTEFEDDLTAFEKNTGMPVRVAVWPKVESDLSFDVYAAQVAQAWRAAMNAKDRGAVMLVFTDSQQVSIRVGPALEGILPAEMRQAIIDEEMMPLLKKGYKEGAVRKGIEAMLLALQGEYQPPSVVAAGLPKPSVRNWLPSCLCLSAGLVFFVVILLLPKPKGMVYSGGGSSSAWWGVAGMLTSMALSGGGGGGFSRGGGGSFGGGGAGGSW